MEVARLGVLDQHPVAGGGKQPRHREVGVIGPLAHAPGGDEVLDRRVLLALVRAFPDPAFDHVATLVDRIGALAEAEVALTGGGFERHPDRLDPVQGPDNRTGQPDRSVVGPVDLNLEFAFGIGGLQQQDLAVASLRDLDHPGGVLPLSVDLETKPADPAAPGPGRLLEHGLLALVTKTEGPVLGPDHGLRRAACDRAVLGFRLRLGLISGCRKQRGQSDRDRQQRRHARRQPFPCDSLHRG